jgi:hypothetical protein
MRNVAPALALSAFLAGCATVPPPKWAVREYRGTTCAATPDLTKAISLVPPKKKEKAKVWTVPVNIDSLTPCLATSVGKGPHVVYDIPQNSGDKVFEVGAVLEPIRIFSPQISILDAEGKETRSFGPEKYLYRGNVFSVQFQPQANERYVLVATHAGNVGKRYESIFTGVAAHTMYSQYGSSNYYTGIDQEETRTFSYEGTVVATVHLPKKVVKK